jgi:lysophospholipase L1-like esterase
MVVVSVALILVGAALPAASAQAGPKRGKPLFEWSMPTRFGARDQLGRVAETQPYAVRPGPWKVDFRVTGRACASARYSWEVDDKRVAFERTKGRCTFRHFFQVEGKHTVRLITEVGHKRIVDSQAVVIQDWLIVSIGDSVASGEGVPEEAGWQSARCHRSALSGTALAARQIEEDDPHSSVTFVHLACSGASVPQGLLGPYGGVIPDVEEPPLTPQIDELNQIARRRQVDAVLLSIGANDIEFSEFVTFCGKTANPFKDCFERNYKDASGKRAGTAEKAVNALVANLPDRYDRLAASISKRIPAGRVHIVEYFDPTRNAKGEPCGHILDILRPNVIRAQELLLDPLNRELARAAERNHWDEVDGVAALFRDHGYCAHGQRWVSKLSDSLWHLPGLSGRHRGTLHPNEEGHRQTAALIAKSLEGDFHLHHDGGNGNGDGNNRGAPGSGGGAVRDVIVSIATVLLYAVALLWLSIAVGLWAPITFLVWLTWDAGAPIVVGVLLAVLLLAYPQNLRHLSRPFRALVRSLRPLVLPLAVVIAVGAVKWSPLVQVLISATLMLLAWRLIVVPEAGEANLNLAFEPNLGKKVAKHGVVALAIGGVAVLILRYIIFPTPPYFEAIGDFPSGLLLLGIVLWAAATFMRLVSHATRRLRAVTAVLLGLCLVILAMAFGLLPWGGGLEDAWPRLVGFLALLALLSALIEGVEHLQANPSSETEAGEESNPPETVTGRMRGLGFSAAAAATVALAFSTGIGLIDAADKGHPLNPPEEDSAEATTRPTASPGDARIELAKHYAPVLVFTRNERWTPVRVGPYVARAHLSGPPKTPSKLTSYSSLRPCPRSQTWCYTLSIECDSGDEECGGGTRPQASSEDREFLHRSGAVYVRTVNRGDLSPSERHRVFGSGGPFGGKLKTLLQYWYFYDYDEWKAPVFAGLLVQRHEGDWEAVTLGLENDRRPLFVAYSAHCAGSWRNWREVEVSTLPSGPRVHPLVAVAEGSHANYPAADQKRSPDWASCAGAPAGVTTAISYASNIRDRTEYSWPWYPADNGWIPVGADTPPMSFDGSWGANDRTTLRNFKTTQLGKLGHGPLSPPLQALWREPVALIFCGKYTPRECEAQ